MYGMFHHMCLLWKMWYCEADMRKGGPECMAGPTPAPPQWSGVSQDSALGLWCLAKNVESADGRSKKEKEEGRRVGGGRCVAALIWSAILVSANQGLPVLRVAEVHLPQYPSTTHLYTNRDTCRHTFRKSDIYQCTKPSTCTHTCTLSVSASGSFTSHSLLLNATEKAHLFLFQAPPPGHLFLSVCLAPHALKLAIKWVGKECKQRKAEFFHSRGDLPYARVTWDRGKEFTLPPQ